MASHRQQGNYERRDNRHPYRSDNRYRVRHDNARVYTNRMQDDRGFSRRPRYLPARDNFGGSQHFNQRRDNFRQPRSFRNNNFDRPQRRQQDRVPPVEVMDAQLKRYMAGEKI